MVEGLYKATFETPFGKGSGVMYFKGGELYGGNTALSYVGKYDIQGTTLNADFRVRRHTNDMMTASVFGMDDINVIVEGVIDGDEITIDGAAIEVPDMQMRGKLELITQ
jgi:hypothetical protein